MPQTLHVSTLPRQARRRPVAPELSKAHRWLADLEALTASLPVPRPQDMIVLRCPDGTWREGPQVTRELCRLHTQREEEHRFRVETGKESLPLVSVSDYALEKGYTFHSGVGRKDAAQLARVVRSSSSREALRRAYGKKRSARRWKKMVTFLECAAGQEGFHLSDKSLSH